MTKAKAPTEAMIEAGVVELWHSLGLSDGLMEDLQADGILIAAATNVYTAMQAARSEIPVRASDELQNRVDAAKFAVSKARLQMARLLDYANRNGLSDEDALAQDTLKAIGRLGEAFPSATDVGTGLPLEKVDAPAPTAPVQDDDAEWEQWMRDQEERTRLGKQSLDR